MNDDLPSVPPELLPKPKKPKPNKPWPWGPGPKYDPKILSNDDDLPDLNDVSFNELINETGDRNKFLIDLSENNNSEYTLMALLGMFNISENQRLSLEKTDIDLIELIENEIKYVLDRRRSGFDSKITALGLNPDNCPGLPLESVLVRRDASVADRSAREATKIVFLRGMNPVKPDKPPRPDNPRPSPTPTPPPKGRNLKAHVELENSSPALLIFGGIALGIGAGLIFSHLNIIKDQ